MKLFNRLSLPLREVSSFPVFCNIVFVMSTGVTMFAQCADMELCGLLAVDLLDS